MQKVQWLPNGKLFLLSLTIWDGVPYSLPSRITTKVFKNCKTFSSRPRPRPNVQDQDQDFMIQDQDFHFCPRGASRQKWCGLEDYITVYCYILFATSPLWHCRLSNSKGIQTVKKTLLSNRLRLYFGDLWEIWPNLWSQTGSRRCLLCWIFASLMHMQTESVKIYIIVFTRRSVEIIQLCNVHA